MTEQRPNTLLRVGCFLFIFGGILSCVVSIATYLVSMGSMLNVDDATMDYINQGALAQTDGLLGGQEVMGILSGIIFVMCAIAVIILILDLIAGLMGLSRCRKPERYRFFLGWGIPLLVIGAIGTLMSRIFTPPALVGLIPGVVAPILYIVGSIQQNKAYNQANTPRF